MEKKSRPRLGVCTRPTCPICSGKSLVFMVAGSSPANVTYYYCPNRCGAAAKVARPRFCNATGKWQYSNPKVFVPEPDSHAQKKGKAAKVKTTG